MPEIIIEDLRKESREQWGKDCEPNGALTVDEVRLGCDLRSADALENLVRSQSSIAATLSYINGNLRELAQMPKKTKTEISRLKRIIKKQKEEIRRLKGEAS